MIKACSRLFAEMFEVSGDFRNDSFGFAMVIESVCAEAADVAITIVAKIVIEKIVFIERPFKKLNVLSKPL